MTGYVTRSQWGARSPSGSGNSISSSPKGVAIHWEGTEMGTFPHSQCDDVVRSIQRYHMDTQGWSDIAYNLLACPHDYVYEGRGKGKGSAANGSTQANADYYAVCALVGQGDPQPAGLTTALQYASDKCRSWGAGSKVIGHRDVYATSCPGDKLYGQVKDGTFGAGGSGGGTMAGGTYWYSGRPSGTITFDHTWKKLDVPTWDPPRSELNMAMFYVNVNRAGLVWDGDAQVGSFRARVMRMNDSDGASAFQTFYIKRDSDDDALFTHVWFEKGVAGHGLQWQFRAADGLKSMKVGTRYAKFACVDIP